MSARNFGEFGIYLQNIIKRLMANQELVKLLYYTNKDPLNNEPLTNIQLKEEIYEKLIKILPRVGNMVDAKSILVVKFNNSKKISNNNDFRITVLHIEIFVPYEQWIIKDENLRPFAIMGEIQKSLDGKNITGLGRMDSGSFRLNFSSDEITSFLMEFTISNYD